MIKRIITGILCTGFLLFSAACSRSPEIENDLNEDEMSTRTRRTIATTATAVTTTMEELQTVMTEIEVSESQGDATELDVIGQNITTESLEWLIDSGVIPLNVTVLNLSNNQIDDLTPLKIFTELQDLTLTNNQIIDLTPLSEFDNLTTLVLIDNHIRDVTPLSALTGLVSLDLINNRIYDISPLSGLTNLEFLDLSYNQIIDFSPLTNITHLNSVSISHNPTNDVNSLKSMQNLKEISMEYTALTQEQIADFQEAMPDCNVTANDDSGINPIGMPISGAEIMTGIWDVTTFEIDGTDVIEVIIAEEGSADTIENRMYHEFYRDGTFKAVFYTEKMIGVYQLIDNQLTLVYDNQPTNNAVLDGNSFSFIFDIELSEAFMVYAKEES